MKVGILQKHIYISWIDAKHIIMCFPHIYIYNLSMIFYVSLWDLKTTIIAVFGTETPLGEKERSSSKVFPRDRFIASR